MTHLNHQTNGASLEDCHTNFFALVSVSVRSFLHKYAPTFNHQYKNVRTPPLSRLQYQHKAPYSYCNAHLCVSHSVPHSFHDISASAYDIIYLQTSSYLFNQFLLWIRTADKLVIKSVSGLIFESRIRSCHLRLDCWARNDLFEKGRLLRCGQLNSVQIGGCTRATKI